MNYTVEENAEHQDRFSLLVSDDIDDVLIFIGSCAIIGFILGIVLVG